MIALEKRTLQIARRPFLKKEPVRSRGAGDGKA
jgi:hypothetical protein